MKRAAHILAISVCLGSFALALPAFAASAASGPTGHNHSQHGVSASVVGSPAQRGQGRVVAVQMTDNAYSMKALTVKAGETIRFMISNKGTLLHEFNINTAAEHAAHRPMMAMMVDHGMITPEKVINLTMVMPDGTKMTHIEPNSVLVEPGKSAEISWKFASAGTLELACNIPGHYETGMMATVTVTPR